MARSKRRVSFNAEEIVESFNRMMVEKPFLPFLIPLILVCWCIERWVFSFSNWVPLVVAVWATLQYSSYQRQMLVDDLNNKWKRVILNTSPITPLEHCEWLNKLLTEIWPNYMNPKLSRKFSSIVEKRLKWRKPKLIERTELREFSLGSCPPSLGLRGIRWSTSGDQTDLMLIKEQLDMFQPLVAEGSRRPIMKNRILFDFEGSASYVNPIMHLGFDWDTTEISILLLAKLAKPLYGTARIVINSLHINGELLLMPVLDGRAVLYSFVSTPQIRIGVAFGSGGSEALPATELPVVSTWLVKLFTESVVKTMVEPRRLCFSLPASDLRKKAVGGAIHVTVVSANKLSWSSLRGSPQRRQQSSSANGSLEDQFKDRGLHTSVEVELGKLTRRTDVRSGSSPQWDSTFNMVLHEETGLLRFHLFNCSPNSVKYDYLASCEIKVKYVIDDSTIFWAIGPDSGVIAKRAEFCGREVEIVVPFEGVDSGELTVKLVMKEWHFSDGSYSMNKLNVTSRQSMNGSTNFLSKTGRRINVTVVEGKDLTSKERSGKYDYYVKLQYGKRIQKTRTAHAPNPIWNKRFEFDEIGADECLMIQCYTQETFGDENIGSARVNLEGLVEGSVRDVWIPLEKVNSGELRLQIEAVRVDDGEGSKGSSTGSGTGWIEVVLLEARDLIAADIRGTSDPYVKVHYGNMKKRTKVMYKTLNPQWNQTLEFPDDGSTLELHVKDHNAVLPTSSIGNCVVEYQRLPPNQMSDKWIPLQGVKRGEMHVQITRKVPELQKGQSSRSELSSSKSSQVSTQMKDMIFNLRSLIEDGNLEGVSIALSEIESLEDTQEEYMVQLETEQMLLLNKIKELGNELMGPSPSLSRRSSAF